MKSEIDTPAELFDQAERDVYRALLIQNARTAKRFDPMGRHRTHAAEGALLKLAKVLVVLGLLLSLLLMVVDAFKPRSIALVLAFAAFALLFGKLPALRQWLISRVDRRLKRRATATVALVRARKASSVEYEVTDQQVIALWKRADGELLQRTELRRAGMGYALLGEGVAVLLKSSKALRPMALLFGGAALEPLLTALGLPFDRIHRDLLPTTTVPRNFDL